MITRNKRLTLSYNSSAFDEELLVKIFKNNNIESNLARVRITDKMIELVINLQCTDEEFKRIKHLFIQTKNLS